MTKDEFDRIWEGAAAEITLVLATFIAQVRAIENTMADSYLVETDMADSCYKTVVRIIERYKLRGDMGVRPSWFYPDHRSTVSSAAAEIMAYLYTTVYIANVEERPYAPKYATLQDWPVVRITAPAWFKHPGFVEWLNTKGTATWHEYGAPGWCSDAFCIYSDGNGSDCPGGDSKGIPEEIWKELEAAVVGQLGWGDAALVWISNLEEEL